MARSCKSYQEILLGESAISWISHHHKTELLGRKEIIDDDEIYTSYAMLSRGIP